MGIKTELSCDVCEKYMYRYTDVRIEIGDSREFNPKKSSKYQEAYKLMVCDDCIGSEIERCNGSHGRFGIKDYGISLLKKLGVLKRV